MPPRYKRTSISQLLVPWADDDLLQQLEQSRIAWEKRNGPTDLTRRYTSMWPRNDRDALAAINPQAFFDGLPQFFQQLLRTSARQAARNGSLDDLPDTIIRLYCKNGLQGPEDSSRSR